jgi:uncharacterized protein (TIGR02246 family)
MAVTVGMTGINTLSAQTGTPAADERAIREADMQFSKAGAAKDLEGLIAFYADDAALLEPNAPLAMGKDAIRTAWSNLIATPGFGVSWKPTKAEASRGGDMGYTIGTYELTMHDPSGKPQTDRGKYVTVWKKQADGTWKSVVDIFNSDLPPAAAPR